MFVVYSPYGKLGFYADVLFIYSGLGKNTVYLHSQGNPAVVCIYDRFKVVCWPRRRLGFRPIRWSLVSYDGTLIVLVK